jgi:hypothetical protein
MPRAIAFGVLGLVAICAIVIGGRRSDPSQQSDALLEFVAPSPAVITNKSDRLQALVERGAELPGQIMEVSFLAVQQDPQPDLPIGRAKQPPDFVPRHWRDPYALKPEAQKRASIAKKLVKRSAEKVRASTAKECPTDGFAPLLRKLRLATDCDS